MNERLNNNIIAEFMGEEVLPIEETDLYPMIKGKYGLRQTHYHDSWEWLMPVVERIMKMGTNVVIKNCSCEIKTHLKGYDSTSVSEEGTIKAIYFAVVEFINWHIKQADVRCRANAYNHLKEFLQTKKSSGGLGSWDDVHHQEVLDKMRELEKNRK